MKAKPTTSSVRHPTNQHSSLGERPQCDEKSRRKSQIIWWVLFSCENAIIEINLSRYVSLPKTPTNNQNEGGTTVTWAPTPTQLPSQQHNHHLSHASTSAAAIATHSDPIKLNHMKIGSSISTGTEIDRIMAKIEQARLSIANVQWK